jgi:NDP-sugar pyrophosphorylase family protein
LYSVAILAGGLASRLGEVTKKLPKSLIEISGKPFIFHQLDILKSQGVKNVVLCLGHLGQMIESAVGDGRNFNLSIKYSYDGDKQLGTGGSIKKALHLLDPNFFVLYGDSLLPINFEKVQKAYDAKKLGLMTIIKNDNAWDLSNVLYLDGKLIEYNKRNPKPNMKYIDYGLSILNKNAFNYFINEQIFDLSDLFALLSSKNELSAFEVYDRFYEIGSKKGIQETEDYLNNFKLG